MALKKIFRGMMTWKRLLWLAAFIGDATVAAIALLAFSRVYSCHVTPEPSVSAITQPIHAHATPDAGSPNPFVPDTSPFFQRIAEARAKLNRGKPQAASNARILSYEEQIAGLKAWREKAGITDGHSLSKNEARQIAANLPFIPPTWQVPEWWVDKSNRTGLCNDRNNCQTATTPCCDINEIVVNRWGTPSPVLRDAAGNPGGFVTLFAIHALSGWSTVDVSDSVNLDPASGFLLFEASQGGTQTGTGNLAGVVAKNANTGQLLTVTLVAGLAAGQLVHNTTLDSYAFTETNTAGNNWTMSQPITFAGAEDNGWANGNAFTVTQNAPLQFMFIGENVDPEFFDLNASLDTSEEGASEYDMCNLGGISVNSPFGVFVLDGDLPGNSYTFGLSGGFFTGGQYRGGNNLQGPLVLRSDFVNAGLQVILTNSSAITNVWTVSGPYKVEGSNTNIGAGGIGYVAGNGQILVKGGAYLNYGGTPAQAFLSTNPNPLTLDGLTTAHSSVTIAGAVTECGGVALTVANLGAAATNNCATTGFGGVAFNPGGSSIGNYGLP